MRATGIVSTLAILVACAVTQASASAAPRSGTVRVPASVSAPGPLRVAVPVLTGVPVAVTVLLSADRRVGPGDRRLLAPVLVRGSRTLRRTLALPAVTRPGARRLLVCLRKGEGRRSCRASAPFRVNARPSVAGGPAATRGAPLPLGVAVWWACIDRAFKGPAALACRFPREDAYEQAALRFDRIVPENELKELFIHPARNVWDFSVADRMVAWARDNGKQVRGHALLFDQSIPRWKARGPELLGGWTRVGLQNELRDHIFTTMRHFRDTFPGVIREWDVVNEPFDPDGTLASNVYSKTLGPRYIEDAFRFAREADPSAILVLNEFDADRPSSVRGIAIKTLVTDLVKRGVPIDAVGLQAHVSTRTSPTATEWARQFADYAALGVDVQLTELDVGTTSTTRDADKLAEQRAVYGTAAGACAAAPNCTGVSVWGVADHHSWRGPEERATLFDPAFIAKPALGDVRKLLARGGK